jgi:hemoglobin-like flavoprotein
MSEDELSDFNDSLERCRRDPRFMDHFYNLFMASSAEVASKFAATDFRRQKRVLIASLYCLMLAAEGHPEGKAHLSRIATLHDRGHRDIRPEYYDTWLACLLQAVRDCDPRVSPTVEHAWRTMLAPGIAVMKGAY